MPCSVVSTACVGFDRSLYDHLRCELSQSFPGTMKTFKSALMECKDSHSLPVVMHEGPEDTPYSGGCFEFDIYFPPTYPHIPMNVQIRTTGTPLCSLSPNKHCVPATTSCEA